jgi:tetratricopeptide (TPR) repeat protein
MRFLIAALWLASVAAEDLHKQGADFYAQKKYSEAITALEQAIKSEDPKSPAFTESALMIGQSYFMLSQAPKSIPWLEKTPASPEANYMLGYAYLQTHELEQAHLAFSRLFGLPATSAGSYLVAGQLMLKKEYESEALAEVQKAVALNPNLPEAHFILGEIAISRHLFDEGVAEMAKEIEVNPNFSMAWYRLGEVLTRQERWSAAIPNLERAIWLNADFSGPYIVLGKCYFKTANYSNAEGILRTALKLDPNNYSATYLLGQTLMAADKKDEGRAVLEKLKNMTPH